LAIAEEYLKRGWQVIGTVREAKKTALHQLATQSGGRLEIEHLDINDAAGIIALRERLDGRVLDLLFVNAGVANDPSQIVGEVTTESFVHVMVTNALSPMRVVESLVDLVPDGGTIGVMSSGLGSVARNETGGWEVYRGSKAALNTFMRSFAARHAGDSRTMLLIAPGWVRTDMGGAHAALSVDESIPKVVDVMSEYAGRTGLHFVNYQGEILPW
jgi:NAD(P)-dependent dehydrogenase (short-subunit alcohol dehydrogenase family)